MLKGVLRLAPETDIQLFRFLWKWKLSTTAAIGAVIYKDRSLLSVYRRLYTLQKGGFIQAIASKDGLHFLWTLDKKGFGLLSAELPPLEQHGYKSEHLGHDFFATAVHCGDWIAGIPSGCDVFTEQELRRFKFENYPAWVPKTTTHRPDGWWQTQIAGDVRKFALEVELSPKTPSEYARLGLFYSEKIQLNGVIWLARNKTEAAYIHRNLQGGLSIVKDRHSFILKDDFLQHCWQASVVLGQFAGTSLQNILNPSNGTKPNPLMDPGIAKVLLDTRKKPRKSLATVNFQNSIFLW